MTMSPTGPLSTVTAPVISAETRVLPVVEESLVVDKRRVDQGGFRISKQVKVRDELVDEPLASEQVSVERRAIGRMLPAMEVPAPRQEGETWIVPVVEEVLVTEKRLLLKEEIRITRNRTISRQPQQFSVRSEEISIERLEPDNLLDIDSL